MRAIVFYPLVAIAAAATIAVSMNYALIPHVAGPQAGVARAGAWTFNAEALSHMDVPRTQDYFLVRNDEGRPTSIQVATHVKKTPPSPAVRGARVLIAPNTAAQWVGKPIRVELRLRPLLYTTAPKLAVSLQGSGPLQWIERDFPHTAIERAGDPSATSVWLQFDLPAASAPPQAIGLWPYDPRDATGEAFPYNAGVELFEMRVGPAPARAASTGEEGDALTGAKRLFALR